MKLNIKSSNFQFNCSIKCISLHAHNGLMLVLPNHEPYVASINDSIVTAQIENCNEEKFFIYKGVAHIMYNEIILYANLAERIFNNSFEKTTSRIEEFSNKLEGKKLDPAKADYYKFLINYLTSMKKALKTLQA